MLGIDGVEDGTRPMTAQVESGRGPIWFFTGRPNALVQHLAEGRAPLRRSARRTHELFASIAGNLIVDNAGQSSTGC